VLLALLVKYVDWLMAVLDSLCGTAMAEALEAIANLDLSACAEIQPPGGYGRDQDGVKRRILRRPRPKQCAAA
jgi:hypothetical protein